VVVEQEGARHRLAAGPVPAGLELLLALGSDDVFAQVAVFFSKMAMVTFGGAYAVLSYVAQQTVSADRPRSRQAGAASRPGTARRRGIPRTAWPWWAVFAQVAVFFSKMAMVTFGGAYAVLSYVAQQTVEQVTQVVSRPPKVPASRGGITPGDR
jgi:hypothetical protein